jgi:hypothetical protein
MDREAIAREGFEVQGTPITGDQGADLIAKKGGRVVIIQAKCYQGMVGNSAVQEVSERNLLAHGCWTDHPKHGWIVREDRGTWPNSKSGPSGSRKIMPEGKPMDAARMAKTVVELDRLIETVMAFKKTLRAA